MRRLLMVFATAVALSIVSGCFSRPTDPVKKGVEESNFGRLEKLKGGLPKGAKKDAGAPNKGDPTKTSNGSGN